MTCVDPSEFHYYRGKLYRFRRRFDYLFGSGILLRVPYKSSLKPDDIDGRLSNLYWMLQTFDWLWLDQDASLCHALLLLHPEGGDKMDRLIRYVAGLLGKRIEDLCDGKKAGEVRSLLTENYCWAVMMLLRFTYPGVFTGDEVT